MPAIGRTRAALYALPAAGTSLLTLAAVLVRPGWPFNHEYLSFAFRTRVWAAHLGRGDLLPIWSSEDTFGMGSPLPLFYHKLFYFLSGGLQLLTGDMKESLVLAIGILLVLGSVGLLLAAMRLGLSPGAASVLAAALPLQTYTQLDWLVRGAMAEFSACMVVPWLFWALLVLVQDRRVSPALPVSLALLALAHSVLAYVAVIPVLLAVLLVLPASDRRSGLRIVLRLAAGAAAIVLLATPYLLAWNALRGDYGVSTLGAGSYRVAESFRPIADYFSPLPWRWGTDWKGVPLAFHPATTLFLILAAFLAVRRLVGRRLAAARGLAAAPDRLSLRNVCGRDGWGAGFLVGALFLLFLLLQLRASNVAYETVPGFQLIQFPWRLLAFLQVAALLLIALAVARVPDARRALLLGAFLVLSIAGSKSLHPIRYDWFPTEELERQPAPGQSAGIPGIGMYPRVDLSALLAKGGNVDVTPVLERLMVNLRVRGAEVVSGAEGCSITEGARTRFEQPELEWRVRCPVEVEIALPVMFSGLERVRIEDGGGSALTLPARRTPQDPRVHVAVPPGDHRLVVSLPRIGRS